MIYVLMAVALFSALTFMVSRQMNIGSLGGTLTTEKAKLRSQELITYATAAKSTVEQQRTMLNVLPNEFNFVKQGEAGYDTAPHNGKVYHPAGGGLNVFVPSPEMFADGSAARGWVSQVGTNVEWSSTTGSDVIFSFVDVNDAVCSAINERMYKETAIPVTTITPATVFINGGGDDVDFEVADCTACNGRNAMCIETASGVNVFYNILISR